MQSKLSSFIRNQSELARAVALLAFVSAFVSASSLAFILTGCSSEPCPEGTKQDGDVCRRLPSKSNASSLAGSAADADSAASGKGGRLNASGKAGAGGSSDAKADASV